MSIQIQLLRELYYLQRFMTCLQVCLRSLDVLSTTGETRTVEFGISHAQKRHWFLVAANEHWKIRSTYCVTKSVEWAANCKDNANYRSHRYHVHKQAKFLQMCINPSGCLCYDITRPMSPCVQFGRFRILLSTCRRTKNEKRASVRTLPQFTTEKIKKQV